MNPIQIRVTKICPSKKWKILRLITKIDGLKQFMPSIQECTVLQKNRKGSLTQWKAELEGVPIRWKEEDRFDFENYTVHFRAIEGDLEKFEGKWMLKDGPEGGTEIILEMSLQIGVPLIENSVGPLFKEKFKKSFQYMLEGMCEYLTKHRYQQIHHRKTSDLRGFGIIAHPYNMQHLIRHFEFHKPDFKQPSPEFLMKLFDLTKAYRFYDVKEFKSKTGKKTHGYFVMCPIIPDMITVDSKRAIHKVVESCKVAEDLGVGVVALGGFASIVAQRFGTDLANPVNVPMTTGNTLTVALALEGVYKAARLRGVNLSQAKVTVIGGAGDIGGTCARILSEIVREVTITGRSEKNLAEVERTLVYAAKSKITATRDNNAAVKDADIVIAAASVSSSILNFDNFKPGAIICDVGYPKNISYRACDRQDIFIFSGGIASLPSPIDLGYDTGLPSVNVLYGCFSEAILLDLEERYENFSWGRGNITKEKVDYIMGVARKHGFDVAPFFWGKRLIADEEVAGFGRVKA